MYGLFCKVYSHPERSACLLMIVTSNFQNFRFCVAKRKTETIIEIHSRYDSIRVSFFCVNTKANMPCFNMTACKNWTLWLGAVFFEVRRQYLKYQSRKKSKVLRAVKERILCHSLDISLLDLD